MTNNGVIEQGEYWRMMVCSNFIILMELTVVNDSVIHTFAGAQSSLAVLVLALKVCC